MQRFHEVFRSKVDEALKAYTVQRSYAKIYFNELIEVLIRMINIREGVLIHPYRPVVSRTVENPDDYGSGKVPNDTTVGELLSKTEDGLWTLAISIAVRTQYGYVLRMVLRITAQSGDDSLTLFCDGCEETGVVPKMEGQGIAIPQEFLDAIQARLLRLAALATGPPKDQGRSVSVTPVPRN